MVAVQTANLTWGDKKEAERSRINASAPYRKGVAADLAASTWVDSWLPVLHQTEKCSQLLPNR